jgi:hypothetical protein
MGSASRSGKPGNQNTPRSSADKTHASATKLSIAEHRTGPAKLRARCFPRPALIGVELSGNLILVKGSVINTSDFLYLTQHVVIS